jgi:mRNA-degrading endonuclease YafQ of YafQ-DinJ toxin-antitoxin module
MAEPIDLDELADEVAAAGFTDKRLAKRLRALIAAVGSDPSVSLPEALNSAELEGAYRFFSNVHVTPDAVLAGISRRRANAARNGERCW